MNGLPGCCGNAACNLEREAKMVVIARDEAGRPSVWCDPCLAPVIRALNDAGIATVASCCGHGRRPPTIALASGQWLVIAPDNDTRLRIERLFATDINGVALAAPAEVGP
jgi:hypothetical protein